MDLRNSTNEEIYKRLIELTKDKNQWEIMVPYVGNLLTNSSDRIKEKALWLIGEMGMKYPEKATPFINVLAMYLSNTNNKVRERSVGALGRIGRANHKFILPYFDEIIALANDPASNVRMNLIWACENIATNAPLLFEDKMMIFDNLLQDPSDRVRIEAPEIFRVIGKRKPELVKPYILKLEYLATNDSNEVVRIHSLGAIKATVNASKSMSTD